MSNDNKSKRPKFSLEFKQDAARLVIEKGYTQQEAADHLGVSLSALRRWVRAERPPTKDEPLSKKNSLNLANQDELVRLRKENERLRMEREILTHLRHYKFNVIVYQWLMYFGWHYKFFSC